MRDEDKSREQLIQELAGMRQRLDELESLYGVQQASHAADSHSPNFDTLTGLPNRLLFYEHLTTAMRNADRIRKLVGVAFLNIDRFKLINDALGRGIGDMLLKSVARRLENCLRKTDTLARPGRAEFMILLPEITRPEDIVMVLERIFASLSAPFNFGAHELLVNARVGISCYPGDSTDAETLIKNAYTAMYHTQEQGKSSFQFFSPSMNVQAFQQLLMENSLRLALKREEFLLHYQPQIDLWTGRIVGMEALLRWQSPEWGMVYPSRIIPLLEETGLILPLGEWVLEAACRQNRVWQELGLPPLTVAVNLSPLQFHQQDLTQVVARTLQQTGLPPSLLELEMTESALIQNETSTIATLQSLYQMGVKLAIADFGTGYSSLSYLRYFPINKLKIDRSFVDSLTVDASDAAISKAVIALAHSLRMKVIAEGVETEDQLEYLRSLDCDEVQGHYISEPLDDGKAHNYLSGKLK